MNRNSINGFPRNRSALTYDITNGTTQNGVGIVTPQCKTLKGDVMVASDYDGSPKPLLTGSRVPVSYASATAHTTIVNSALVTATLSTNHLQLSICPTKEGGFAILNTNAVAAQNFSLFVFSNDNVLVSSSTPATGIQAALPGDENGCLCQLTNGGFVSTWRNVSGAIGQFAITYPLGGGTAVGTTSLGNVFPSICSSSDGNWYLLATLAATNAVLTKRNTAGTVLWTANLGASNSFAHSVIELSNGNVAAVYNQRFAIYDSSGNVVVADQAITGIIGDEVTAAPLAGGGFVISTHTSGGANERHFIYDDAGTQLFALGGISSWNWCRSHPSGGYFANKAVGILYGSFDNNGAPSVRVPGTQRPLPLIDGKVATIQLNGGTQQITTEVYAGSGTVFGVALDDCVRNQPTAMQVEGQAVTRTNWSGGGAFNHRNKVPAGNAGAIIGNTATLGGYV